MTVKTKITSILAPRGSAVIAGTVKTPQGEFLAGPHTASYLVESAVDVKLSDLAKRMDSGAASRKDAAEELRALLLDLQADSTDQGCYGGRASTVAHIARIAASLDAGESQAIAIQAITGLVDHRRYGVLSILMAATRGPSPDDVPRNEGQPFGAGARSRGGWSVWD